MADVYVVGVKVEPGERWDGLAWRCYGGAADYRGIMDVNEDVMLLDVLDSGVELLVPVVDVAVRAGVGVNVGSVPPWKR